MYPNDLHVNNGQGSCEKNCRSENPMDLQCLHTDLLWGGAPGTAPRKDLLSRVQLVVYIY